MKLKNRIVCLVLTAILCNVTQAGVGEGVSQVGTLSSKKVNVEEKNIVPNNFRLEQNYPNPFNPTTTISFYLPEYSSVKVIIYDLRGSLIKSLYDGNLNSGSHNYIWDGTNSSGQRVTSGCYFYQVKSNNHNEVKKMFLLK